MNPRQGYDRGKSFSFGQFGHTIQGTSTVDQVRLDLTRHLTVSHSLTISLTLPKSPH